MNYQHSESEMADSGIYKTFSFTEGCLKLRIYQSLLDPFICLSWCDDENPINDSEKTARIKNDFNVIMRIYRTLSIRIPKLTAIDGELLHEMLTDILNKEN